LEPGPVRYIGLLPTASVTGPKVWVVLALLLPIGLWLWADRRALRRPALVGCALLVLAGAMTAMHVFVVDKAYVTITPPTTGGAKSPPQIIPYSGIWQRYLYLAVFNNGTEPYPGLPAATIPHIYRPLPYGFTRLLESPRPPL